MMIFRHSGFKRSRLHDPKVSGSETNAFYGYSLDGVTIDSHEKKKNLLRTLAVDS